MWSVSWRVFVETSSWTSVSSLPWPRWSWKKGFEGGFPEQVGGTFVWRRRIPLETVLSSGDGAFLWRRRSPLETAHTSGEGVSLWKRYIPLETAVSSGDGAFFLRMAHSSGRRRIPLGDGAYPLGMAHSSARRRIPHGDGAFLLETAYLCERRDMQLLHSRLGRQRHASLLALLVLAGWQHSDDGRTNAQGSCPR